MPPFDLDPSRNSSFVEKLIEHAFISEMLQEAAFARKQRLEVSRPEVDMAGYDLLMECGGVIRHVQLKASKSQSKTSVQKVHLDLGKKPSGCVVWIFWEVDDAQNRVVLSPFLFFGSSPGKPLPSLSGFRTAKHTKGDSTGRKKERPMIRSIPKGKFKVLGSANELLNRLFG